MSKRLKFEEIMAKDVPVADYLPYSCPITDRVVRTIDGSYVMTWLLAGVPFETVDPIDMEVRHLALNDSIKSLGDDLSYWTHRIRHKSTDRLTTDYRESFCAEMARRYYDGFKGYAMMQNDLYLTVVYTPESGRLMRSSGILSGANSRSLEDIREDELDALKRLDDLSNKIAAELKKYQPRPLGTYIDPESGVEFSEQLEFYGFLINGVWEQIPLLNSPIREYLPTSRLFFSSERIEIRTIDATRFVAMLDIMEYPETVEPGVTDLLNFTPYEYIESQSFKVLDRTTAMDALDKQRKQMRAGGDPSESQRQALESAMDDLSSGRWVLGEYYYSLAVFGDTPEQAGKHLAAASSALSRFGFKPKAIELVADAAWFAQTPANWRWRARAAKLTSRNFAALAPYHSFPAGKRDRNPWGEAVTILKTPSGSPCYFNFHAGPVNADTFDKKQPGNTTIIGPTGTGKTVLELFLVLMARKYGMTTVFFDKDQGAEIAIRALGGKYQNLRRGIPTGYNPFLRPDTELNNDFLFRLMRQLVGRKLSPREEQELNSAIREIMRSSDHVRSISGLCQLLPPTDEHSLHAHLQAWCRGGRLGWVFDNPEDCLDLETGDLFGFDDTQLLDDPEVSVPLTMYLLHCTETLIDGRRFCYVMAEFWKRLDSPAFTDFARNKQYTIRKQNGFGVFDTQSPDQILQSKHGKALVEQSPTQIYLPNPKADYNDYVKGFKVSEQEFEIIRSLNPNSRQFLIKQSTDPTDGQPTQDSQSVVATLDLKGMDDVLDIISGTLDNAELLDVIRAEVGDDPDIWMPIFRERLRARRGG